MPVYEYTCRDCGERFELLHRSQLSRPSAACPHCESRRVSREFSVFAAGKSREGQPVPPNGGCGRCGDPNGSCNWD